MKMIANYRAKQTIVLQGIIIIFFGVSIYNLTKNGVLLEDLAAILISAVAIIIATISIIGVSLYILQYYVELQDDKIFCNTLSFKKRSVALASVFGYTFDRTETLVLRAKDGMPLMEIRCCYLKPEDKQKLLEVVKSQGDEMVFQKKVSVLSKLFTAK